MLPGPEKAIVLRHLQAWVARSGYTMSATENECCQECRQRATKWVAAGNVALGAVALLGSRFGLGYRVSDGRTMMLGFGSAIAGGLGGWCAANVQCFRTMLKLSPPTPLTDHLQSTIKDHGTARLQQRYASDEP